MSVPHSTTDAPYAPHDDHPIIIAHGACRTTSWTRATTSWSDVCSWVDLPADTKECGGYVLGDFTGEGAASRSKDTFRSAWAVKLDAERKDGSIDPELVDNLENLGYDAIAHTTASSTTEAPRWRFLILADRTMNHEELAIVTRAVEHELGAENFDPTAGQGERFMFRPARGKDGSYEKRVMYGEPLDVDMWIERGKELAPKKVELDPAELEPTRLKIIADADVSAWVDNILAPMDELRDKPAGEQVRYRGKHVGWDTGFYFMACDLVRVSNSSNGVLDLVDAEKLFYSHAPKRDDGFNPKHKWRDAVNHVGKAGVHIADTPTTGREERGYNPFSAMDADLALNMGDRALGERFRYTTGLGWLEWDGARWSTECPPERVLAAVVGMVPEMLKEWSAAGVDGKVIRELARTRSSQKAGQVAKMLSAFLLIKEEQLDTHAHLLNARNGTINLETGELHEHRRGDLITKITEVDYVAGATHDDWDAALQAIADDGTRAWLQMKFGQGITGHPASDEALAILKGGGSNGKSVMLDAIMGAIGDFGVSVSPRVLTGNTSDHPTEKMDLRGARLAVSEELPDGRHLNEVTIKQLVGTERITARLMRQDNIVFKATHSMFVTTNYDLQVSGSDDGTWRRFQLIPFPFRYTANPQPGTNERLGDPLLKRRMRNQAQRQAVLSWVVAGAVKLNKEHDGITPPPSEFVNQSTNDWRANADVVYAYSRDRLVFESGSVVLTQELFDDFSQWQEERGGRPMSMNTFMGKFLGAEFVRKSGVEKARENLTREPSRPPHQTVLSEWTPGARASIAHGVRFVRGLEIVA